MAQNASTQTGTPAEKDAPAQQMRFSPGASLRTQLDKTIDAKKAKVGDPVVLKTLDDIMSGDKEIAPVGAKIYGHIVEVTPHQGDTPSTLGIAFDKMDLGKGNEVPFKAVIQAVSHPQESVNLGQNDPMSTPSGAGSSGGSYGRAGGMASGGGSNGGAPPTAGNPGNPADNSGGQQLPRTSNLPVTAQGVIGMSGVTLGTGPQQESLLTSQKKNVKLEGGTQMIVRTQ